MSNPSLSWQKLQDVYYSLRPCYEGIKWPLTALHSNYHVKISTHCSLIAVSSKFVPHPAIVDVYSVSGTKFTSVVYNSGPGDHITGYGWKNEDLVVVLNGGKFRYYKEAGGFNEYDVAGGIELTDVSSTPTSTPPPSAVGSNGGSNDGVIVGGAITDLETNTTEEPIDILEVNIWGKFLVLRLRNQFIITDLSTFTNYTIPNVTLAGKILCLSLLKIDEDVDSITLLASYDTSILTLRVDITAQEFEIIDQGLTEGPFTQICASPNSQLVSLYNAKAAKIFVINSKFDRVLLEYDTASEIVPPVQVTWCGNDAIVLSLRDELKLIGPGQKSISFYYDMLESPEEDVDTPVSPYIVPILYTEPDGVKVLTSNKLEFLSLVPECNRNLYLIGSSSPSSILLDCIDKLSQHSPKADTNISLLKSDGTLPAAMNECLQASLEEFQPYWQKKLLRAVSFGKVYCTGYDTSEYLHTVSMLKVLNQIRSSEIGIFITYKQLLSMGWETVISMLLRRNLHYLALRIIELVNEEQYISQVYIHWCCYKITKELNMSDADLFKSIEAKLTGQTGKNLVSVGDISEVAFQEGRVELCKLLINLEPSIAKKISRFVHLGDLELALIKSFQTGAYDLCRLLLLHLQEKLTPSKFFKILNQNESKGLIVDTSENTQSHDSEILYIHGDLIGNFWVGSIGRNNKKLLESYYRMEDKSISDIQSIVKEFSNEKMTQESSGSESESYYSTYKTQLVKFINSSATQKQDAKLYQKELDLLELQKKLSDTYKEDFYSKKSIVSILSKLIEMNQVKPAGKISKDFNVSIEKFWYLVLDIYTKTGQFDRLHSLIVGQESTGSVALPPIGFQPIIERCLAFGAPNKLVSVYIKNSTNVHYTEKIDMFIKNHDLASAAGEAYRFKDIEYLRAILDKSQRDGSVSVVNLVKNYITRLGY
ncbi:vacuolar protein sorting-associated protein 16 [[Candida] anglica]|uniref:Probable vacuolar protein sorting-associated protein 16 homolog n=1 Tax=[Candida] anglica TaxID=148631 RepID=A0ABP0ECY9_9ASCO